MLGDSNKKKEVKISSNNKAKKENVNLIPSNDSIIKKEELKESFKKMK